MILPNTHTCYSMVVHMYDVGPVLKQYVQQVAYSVYTHAHNTLTLAQPGDFLVIQGTIKTGRRLLGGGGRGGGGAFIGGKYVCFDYNFTWPIA